MANMSTSENITWFPITPALFEEDYNGVAVIVDDILRGGNITENSEFIFLPVSDRGAEREMKSQRDIPRRCSRLVDAPPPL